MTGRVCHINDHVDGAVYVGRAVPRRQLAGSTFANPHKIQGERQLCIDKFEFDITEGPLRPLLANLPDLRDKPLACWCRHDGEPWTADTWCHADVLLDLLNRYTDDELRALATQEVRACSVCGCTDAQGCWPPCWWVGPNLCSSCAGKDAVPSER